MDNLTLWAIVIICAGVAVSYYVVLKNTSKKDLELAKTKSIPSLNFSSGGWSGKDWCTISWPTFRKYWKKFLIIWVVVLILAVWWSIKSN
jgi:hypothetical protein